MIVSLVMESIITMQVGLLHFKDPKFEGWCLFLGGCLPSATFFPT